VKKNNRGANRGETGAKKAPKNRRINTPLVLLKTDENRVYIAMHPPIIRGQNIKNSYLIN